MIEEQVSVAKEYKYESSTDDDGVIYFSFSVISDGTTGSQWIERLESKGFRVSKWAKDVLNSPDFKPTTGVTTKIAVLPGKMFDDSGRVTKKIRAEAEHRNLLLVSNAEIACLAREKLSDDVLKAMGLWWLVFFHEPIKDSDGDPFLLTVLRSGDGRWLDTFYDYPGFSWRSADGFAFAVSQD